MRLPLVKDLISLLKELKSEIGDEYRSYNQDHNDRTPSMDVTIGWDPEDGAWDYQTGDNSYMGSAYHYPIWAVITLYRRANCTALAQDIRAQLADQACP